MEHNATIDTVTRALAALARLERQKQQTKERNKQRYKDDPAYKQYIKDKVKEWRQQRRVNATA
jgi:hypothetical protein